MPDHDLKLISHNIPKLYLGAALSGFAFFYNAIDTLYYRHFDLSFQQIGLLLSTTLLTALLLEIPTGAFADLQGKKISIVLAGLFNTAATVFVVTGSSFIPFLAGFVCWGVGRAFNSGASSALLYDTLKGLGQTDKLIKHTAHMSSLFICIDILSGALAPLFYAISVRLPFYVSLFAAFSAVTVQLTLYEVPTKDEQLKTTVHHHLQQIGDSLSLAIKNNYFIWMTIFSVVLVAAGKIFAEMISTPFLIHDLHFSLPELSLVALLGSLIQTIFVFSADKLEAKLGDKQSFLLVLTICPLAMLAYAYSHYVLVTAFLSGLLYGAWSYGEVIVETQLSHHSPDDKRATILSISAMAVSGATLIMLPLIGTALDRISLQAALAMLALTVVVSGLFLYSRYEEKGSST